MKKNDFLFFTFFFISLSLMAQTDCSEGRYKDSLFKVDVIEDVVYGSNYNYLSINSTLRMDIYQPQGDVAKKRPLIIIAPGGSFVAENKQDYPTQILCQKFASLGYVAVGMDYRVGVLFPTQEQFRKALLRATHDMRAVVRYFRKDAATSNAYKIDTNIIVVGGSSAGAFMALHVGYLDKISEILSQEIDTTNLGGVEGLSGNLGYSSKVNYIVNLCGALGDTSFMEPGNIPVISMHGTNDNTVPYASGKAVGIIYVEGSATIKKRADNIGVENPFYSFYGADHVPYDASLNLSSYELYMDTTFAFVRDHLYNWICGGSSFVTNYKNEGIKISPNPFHEFTEISAIVPFQNASLEIIDITGKSVARYENMNDHKIIIHRKGLSNGLYLYKIYEHNILRSTGKLSIQ